MFLKLILALVLLCSPYINPLAFAQNPPPYSTLPAGTQVTIVMDTYTLTPSDTVTIMTNGDTITLTVPIPAGQSVPGGTMITVGQDSFSLNPGDSAVVTANSIPYSYTVPSTVNQLLLSGPGSSPAPCNQTAYLCNGTCPSGQQCWPLQSGGVITSCVCSASPPVFNSPTLPNAPAPNPGDCPASCAGPCMINGQTATGMCSGGGAFPCECIL